MRAWIRVCVILSAFLPLGCLVRNTTYTLLLEPDGGVTWIVLEHNVRSDCDDADERRAEEGVFMTAASSGDNTTARAFRALGAAEVEVSVIRERRPYAVVTEARFDSVAEIAERYFAAEGLTSRARFSSDGAESRLELELEVPWEDGSPPPAGDGLGMPDPDDLGRLVILLTEGRFVAAEGFTIDGDRAEMIPVSDEELRACGGMLDLSLTWTTAPNPVS